MNRTPALFLLACAACATGKSTSSAPAASPAPVDAGPPPVVDAGATAAVAPPEDPYLWLEDVTGEKALAWAREQNTLSQAELEATPGFAPLRDRLRAILDSNDKIPFPQKMGGKLYNFWRDAEHPRGLWRRTTEAEYKKPAPKWETVLDLDALGTAEKENWVWKGAVCLYPDHVRCMLKLSRGGADATVVREFDTTKKAFVEGGFTLPEAKTDVAWKDKDALYVGTDFGPGTLTESGYARQAREWKRGTPLQEAALVYEGQASDVRIVAQRTWDHGRTVDIIQRAITFYTAEHFVRVGDKLVKVEVPDDAEVMSWNGQLLFTLRSDWTVDGRTLPRGAAVVAPWDDFMAGKRSFTLIFEPAPNRSLAGVAPLKTAILVNELEDVHNRVYAWTLKGGAWKRTPVISEGLAAHEVDAVQPYDADTWWLTSQDFTRPTTLSLGTLGKAAQVLKQSPAFFKADGLVVEQHFVASADGTRVPYFQVSRSDLALDGTRPTLLYGYGGFEVPLSPKYDPIVGAAWLESGGVYVVANIRGGGEYGPAWHQAALKANRQRAYDDFIAVAEDLVKRKVTSPRKLGIRGGSNGGLLMGVMLTQRPDLWGAVVCAVPLLDMKRYHKLLAGASWMAEYGDPDKPEEWEFIRKYSPYQNVKSGVTYPRVFITTSTRDDRVHPGHARKMVARLREMGHALLYYENIEGGHGGAANNEQRAYVSALSFAYLGKQLELAPR